MVEAREQGVQRNGLGEIVELVAVGAGEIAPSHRDDVSEDGMIGGGQAFRNHADLPRTSMDRFPAPPETFRQTRHT
jgi:hypothetical protein